MAVQLRLSGRVQGVGMRQFTKRLADKLDIAGHVTNLDDGRVEVIADGAQLPEFIEALRLGPPSAKIETIDEREIDAVDTETFSVQ